jgi:phytoene synthase
VTSTGVSADAAQHAGGSSFYLAMRILPRRKREAMFEVYKFCRKVDDVADSTGPRDPRIDELQRYRDDVAALYAGRSSERMGGFLVAVKEFALRRDDFLAIIDGMEMDVVSDIRAPDLATFDLYCDRVASAVGRLSVRIFGLPNEDGIQLSHHLGRALQTTNILRDLDEDADMGRLYLPREYLDEAGIAGDEPSRVLADPNLGKACAPLIESASEHFRKAGAVMDRQPRASVRAPRIMAEAYAPMLDRLQQRGFAAPRERVRLDRLHLLMAVLRYGIF